MIIRQATPDDAGQIVEIYNDYIRHSIITFETIVLEPEEMAQRIRSKLVNHNWLVGEVDGTIIGYAYYGAFRPRVAYGKTVESTIYLAPAGMGKGYGRQLYRRLMESIAQRGFREVIGIISLPNPGSIALHRKVGFEEVGVLRKVGHKFGDYIDVAIWQKSINVTADGAKRQGF